MKLGIEQYKAFLEELAKNKKVDLAEMKKKMANCGPPGVTGGAVVSLVHKYASEISSFYSSLLEKRLTSNTVRFIVHNLIDENKFLRWFHK